MAIMVTNEIVESPRLLFLGAGASKPLGKMLMGEFVQHLLSGFPNESYSPLLRAICEKNPDLEFLIEQLEEISSKRYLGNVHTRRRGDGELYSIPAAGSELAALASGLLTLIPRVDSLFKDASQERADRSSSRPLLS